MDAAFWHARWESGQTRFNQAHPNRHLTAHWSRLGVAPETTVFVPLCGKSIDMVWLAEHGHRVVGVELSERAVAEFFSERGLDPATRDEGSFTVAGAGPYELWCGDLFELEAGALAATGAVYDRASLVALPADVRRRYASHLSALLPVSAPLFVIAFEYDQDEMAGPPFSVGSDEVAALYDRFALEVVVDDDVLAANPDLVERGLTRLRETAVILRRR